MKHTHRLSLLLITCLLFAHTAGNASVMVGTGASDITPPAGTPSAGYLTRQGKGMSGTHDPLQATALIIDNGEKKIALCGVDNLGFTNEMVREITAKAHAHPLLSECEIYIGSSHTHSGGGGHINIPLIGEKLAGPYDPLLAAFYIEGTVKSLAEAAETMQPALIGIGYGQADGISLYRGQWPTEVTPLTDITVIKATKPDGTPLAVLFNFPLHPTVLNADNWLFSADFVGYARNEIMAHLGNDVRAIFFNGAQGEIVPNMTADDDRFRQAGEIGYALAASVLQVWQATEVKEAIAMESAKHSYSFKPQPTPIGMTLPLSSYDSELNLLVFDSQHAFVTIPGELSCCYDRMLKAEAADYGYTHLSILGLVNDAHGYIILPEAWKHGTAESRLSFGGEHYGTLVVEKVRRLLQGGGER